MFALALIGALFAAPLQSATPNWRQSSGGTAETKGAAAYIDASSIQRQGDIAIFWREIRYPEQQKLTDGRAFDRLTSRLEANCTALTLRTLEIRGKLGDKIIGEDKEADKAGEPVEPGSAGMADLNAACFGKWKSGAN